MFIRRLPRFEYHAPTSLDEALKLLAQYGSKARVFAGGTDLFGAMKRREIVPDHLINLKGIDGLKGIDHDETAGLSIGGLTLLGDLERLQIIKDKLTILWDAINVLASPQIRNLGTIGGNLCGAVPSADTVPPLIASGASVKLTGNKEERTVLVEQFFKGPRESVLRKDEILTRIIIPDPPENSGGAYFKLMTRNAMELAIVGVGAHLILEKDGKTCRKARIALGAVAPTPTRAHAAEEVLNNQVIDEDLAGKAGKVASSEASPISNVRASKEYRMEMIAALTKKAVMAAYQRIQAKSKR
jgi:CO/xanthine dehydrogenase FAD-binding subunit